MTVLNNVIYAPNTQNTLLSVNNSASGSATLVAYNNTLVGGGAFGLVWLNTITNPILRNNVVQSLATNARLVRLTSATVPTANLSFNLYYAPNSTQPFWNETTSAFFTFAQWQAAGFDASSKNADPLFVNLAGQNFHLQGNSPAVNAGTAIPSVPLDRDLVARPQPPGGLYDIGAYEVLPAAGNILLRLVR